MNKEHPRCAFIFPGQGSQYVGMGKDFFSSYSVARHFLEMAEDITKKKISQMMLEGPIDVLTQTSNSQLAIFVMSMAIYRVVAQQFPDYQPIVCAGLSLGEYCALVASGKISYEDALVLVTKRAQFMHDACERHKGTMAVVMGLEAEEVEKAVAQAGCPQDLWVANLNCPGQIVISGTEKGIELGKAVLIKSGAKKLIPLSVHGAFHSGLMQEAADRLAPYIHKAQIKESSIGFYMNVVASRVDQVDEIRKNLELQVTHPVRWEASIRSLDAHYQPDLYIEMGPGKTLAGMNKKIGVSSPTVNVEQIADLEKLAQLLENSSL